MKILTLIHEYPPVGGGGGRAAMDIARNLVMRGHEVKVITAHYGDLDFVSDDHGVEVLRLRSFRKESFRADLLTMMGYVLTAFFHGMKVAKQWNPDVIHVHFAVPAGAAAYAIALLTGIPYVMTVQLGDVPGASPEKTSKWFRWIKPFTYPIWNKASRIAAVSIWVKEMAEKTYSVPIVVIPNGVSLCEMNPETIMVNQPPRIIFAGRFVEQKNVLTILNVLNQLKDLDWCGVLAGDGALYSEVEQYIKKYDLEDRLTLTGWIAPSEVQEWNRKSDIVFMPSLSEGLPLAGVAAMAMGLAMVMSNVGGNVDLVEVGRNGYLFAPMDVEKYVEVLGELLRDPQKLLSFRLESRKLAERFDQEKVTGQYENLFKQAVIQNR